MHYNNRVALALAKTRVADLQKPGSAMTRRTALKRGDRRVAASSGRPLDASRRSKAITQSHLFAGVAAHREKRRGVTASHEERGPPLNAKQA
jgi:hypothetical protein